MEVIHRISLTARISEVKAFRAAGVEIGEGFTTFSMSEHDARWKMVSKLIMEHAALDVPYTKFSASEIESSACLAIFPIAHKGYPAPRSRNGIHPDTYDLSDYCPVCGQGKQQRGPIRFHSAPKLGNKEIVQTNWLFDEFFTSEEIWHQVFKPVGVEMRKVILDKTGALINGLVQLVIADSIDLLDVPSKCDYCTKCGRPRFAPITTALLPQPVTTPRSIAKSSQVFGSGGSAHSLVLISKRLFRSLQDAGVHGLTYWPCESDSQKS